jgi:hypothetical protein
MGAVSKVLGALAGGVALVVATAAPLPAALLPTQVSPAGDYLALDLPVGGAATYVIGDITVTCAYSYSHPKAPVGSNIRNQIPTAGNPTASGPLSFTFNWPWMLDCNTATPGLDASVVTDGSWTLSLRHRATRETFKIKIPKNGILITTSGTAACTITVAPAKATSPGGAWTNGSPSQMTLTDARLPVTVTGGAGCPVATNALFSVTYLVTNVSNPSADITVG